MRNEEENNQDVEWAWVDYVEGDVEPEMKQDLQNLLRLSSDSREVVSDLHWTKEMVKSLDPAHDEFLEKWDAKASLEKILKMCQTQERPSSARMEASGSFSSSNDLQNSKNLRISCSKYSKAFSNRS